jgi:hypothetical protein
MLLLLSITRPAVHATAAAAALTLLLFKFLPGAAAKILALLSQLVLCCSQHALRIDDRHGANCCQHGS